MEIRSSGEKIQTSRKSENSAKLLKIRIPKFRIFKKIQKFPEKLRKNCKFWKMSNIFLGKCGNSPIFEKLGWKVAVKEVNFCSFRVVLVRIHFLSFSSKFSTREISSNCKKKSKNAEFCVRKTLFLEVWIWWSICRIWMKNGWW